MSIKVTFTPTPISGIINGKGLKVTCSSNPSTWVLTTRTNTFTNYVGKDKVQEIMASFAPLIGSSSSMVMTIGSLQKFITTVVAYTNEKF